MKLTSGARVRVAAWVFMHYAPPAAAGVNTYLISFILRFMKNSINSIRL